MRDPKNFFVLGQIIVTIVTGVLIAGSTLGILTVASFDVRTALFGMDALKKQTQGLEQEVRQLRRRKSGAVATGSLFAEPAAPSREPAPATITLRGDGLQVARFEALLEKAQKLGLVASGVDRLDAVLAGLEALVAGRGATATGPAAQIIIHQCPDCGAAVAVTQRGELALAPAQVAAAACDARVRKAGGDNRATIPPKTRAAVLARDRHRCATPGCRSTRFPEVHHLTPRAHGGSNRAENLVTLCSRCHRFAHESAGTVAPAQVGSSARI